ncbi:hypothetical protein TWF225_002294 [Orbilia oligospora]|nr:hypothetical protein TWF225_002294 [Orbilia oligospora]KAF3240495.1 hypothetical protein TWF217_000783 [Orbilia oligospora]KAF3249341.1 hypothetical protein TWF128_007778 [Orbilia oligospora]
MPPLRRKKKGEDDLSSDTSVQSHPRHTTTTTTKPLAPSISSNMRSNPLGNKATRPINSRNSPPPDSFLSKSPTKQFQPSIIRQNSKQTPKPLNRLNLDMAVVTPQLPSDRHISPSSPVSPVSPIAHELNQISIRAITPPSLPESRLVRHEEANDDATQAIIPQTPGTEMRRRRAGTRKISRFEKDRLIENIRYEVERRAKALRQRYTLQAEMLRQGIELRVGRIPYKMRNMKMGDLYDQAVAAAEQKMEVEAKQAVKEIEDVRRLSNPQRPVSPLRVVKKRALSPVKSSEPIRAVVRPPSPIKSSSPPRAIAPKSTIKLVPRTSPTQLFNPPFPTSSPVKTVPSSKSMPTLKNKLAAAGKPIGPGVATPGLRTVASTITRTPGSAVPTMKPLVAIAKPKIVKGKTPATSSTTNPGGATPITKKSSGRSLRSRK